MRPSAFSLRTFSLNGGRSIAEGLGQLGGHHGRAVADRLERGGGPRAGGGALVVAGELPADRRPLLVARGRPTPAARSAGPRPRGGRPPGTSGVRRRRAASRGSRRRRPTPARRASSSVIADGSIGSTESMASWPAAVMSVPPTFTIGRFQDRNATVISPDASPGQVVAGNSTASACLGPRQRASAARRRCRSAEPELGSSASGQAPVAWAKATASGRIQPAAWSAPERTSEALTWCVLVVDVEDLDVVGVVAGPRRDQHPREAGDGGIALGLAGVPGRVVDLAPLVGAHHDRVVALGDVDDEPCVGDHHAEPRAGRRHLARAPRPGRRGSAPPGPPCRAPPATARGRAAPARRHAPRPRPRRGGRSSAG